MKKLLLTLLAVAMISVPAFASVQNIKVGGDIDSTYLFRKNFDLGNNVLGGDEYQSLFITQTRLRVDSDLTDNVSATIALINERVWTRTQDSASTDIDLNLAYVTLREMLYSPLTIIIGRQDFRYGNSLIIDSMGQNNVAAVDSGLQLVAGDLSKQTAFDAIRAILDYNPLKVELAFVELEPSHTTLTLGEDDVKLYGINASYEFGDEKKSMAEAYVWKKVDETNADNLNEKADIIVVKGLRGSTNLTERINLQAEYAMQTGSKRLAARENRKRRAHAFELMANVALPVLEEYTPMLSYVFLKTTGDKRTSSETTFAGDYTGWDPMYENQSGGTIYNTLFPLTNCIIQSLALSGDPIEDLNAELKLTSLWLERDYHENNALGLLQPDNDPIAAGSLQTKTRDAYHLGKELDLKLTYDYTEDVQIGMNMGWFFPGSVFKIVDSENENTAKQLLVNCLVKF